MPANVEIKARVRDPERLRAAVERISGSTGELLLQEDIFFRVPAGRLKLRVFDAEHGQLIAYERPDQQGPKFSQYTIAPTSRPAALRQILEGLLGIRGVVRKRRQLFLIGATRVHLDRVEGLGNFVELEVVLRDGQTAEDGERRARQLMATLGITEDSLVAQAYIDLLADTLHAEPPVV